MLPAHWFGSNSNGRIVWEVELGFFLLGAAAMARKRSDQIAKRRTLLFAHSGCSHPSLGRSESCC
jgi:hypothetical protein